MPEEKYTPTQIAEMLEVYGNLRANSESFLSTSTPRGELIVRAVNLFKTIPKYEAIPPEIRKRTIGEDLLKKIEEECSQISSHAHINAEAIRNLKVRLKGE